MRQLPNLITGLRIVLVLPIAWLLWHGDYTYALALMVVAGLSDAIDGALARRYQSVTPLGETLDPIADKLLVVAMFVIFTVQGFLPLWLAVIVIGRDLIILAGAGVYRMLFSEIDIAPTLISKANTAMQFVTLVLLLIGLSNLGLVSQWAAALVNPFCFFALAILGVGSGLDYVITWGVKAYRESRNAA